MEKSGTFDVQNRNELHFHMVKKKYFAIRNENNVTLEWIKPRLPVNE